MFGPRGRSTWCAETVMDSDTPEELLRIDLAPARNQIHLLGKGERLGNVEVLLRALGQLDVVASLHLVGSEVHDLAVDQDAFVRNQLAGLGTGDRETHAVHDVVQALFEHLQQRFTGVALATGSLGVIAAELALEQSVDALDLLLLAKLGGVVGQLALAGDGTVLARLLLELAL